MRTVERIVKYADDFVICCRYDADEALAAMRELMSRLRLTVNESKTRVRRVPAETFDFLEYTIGTCYRVRTGKPYIGAKPSGKRIVCMKLAISDMTTRRWFHISVRKQVEGLNRAMRGWANYFSLGAVTAAYRAVDYHTRTRLRHWLSQKHRTGNRGVHLFPDQHLYDELGLVKLCTLTKSLPWAKA